eukprot:8220026-Alexandrium_andersonii.AAC.1
MAVPQKPANSNTHPAEPPWPGIRVQKPAASLPALRVQSGPQLSRKPFRKMHTIRVFGRGCAHVQETATANSAR